jgi:hypothetical protein
VNGLAGYFEAVLYDGGEQGKVELSTRPDTIDAKSKDMISWFPIFFPVKVSLKRTTSGFLTLTILVESSLLSRRLRAGSQYLETD